MEDKENNGRLKKTSFLFKLGVALILLSFLKWGVLLYVPFLPYSGNMKISIITVLLVLAEITFWVGVFLVGEETYKKYKYYFNPINWFKKAAKEVLDEEKRELNAEKTADITDKEKSDIHKKEISDPNYKEDR
ncbi:MAG: hypothetical protein A2231_12050 [Candidatus Firestonebacteria bacterium RIFOXYA2_FULL_40_8]|nr:MAG: hypothetical protein A2231_12050 [Candidatus Firestonebacteria bacterium RIFOXYA2_FULL_40_8]